MNELPQKPVPVTVTRPDFNAGEALGLLAAEAFNTFVNGWLLMLILGSLHHDADQRIPALGYWPSVLIVIGVAAALGTTSTFRYWTRPTRSGEK
jgi:fluoride ion exporter CrcB/FEX